MHYMSPLWLRSCSGAGIAVKYEAPAQMPVKPSQPAKVKRNGTGRKYTGKPVNKPETAPVGDEAIQGEIIWMIPIHACRITYFASLICIPPHMRVVLADS